MAFDLFAFVFGFPPKYSEQTFLSLFIKPTKQLNQTSSPRVSAINNHFETSSIDTNLKPRRKNKQLLPQNHLHKPTPADHIKIPKMSANQGNSSQGAGNHQEFDGQVSHRAPSRIRFFPRGGD
jgi:hypothetical protein